jgi:hypothetical protein
VYSVAAAEQDDQDRCTLDVIDAISGAIVNAQFADAFADGPDVAGIAEGQTLNSGGDSRSGLRVAKGSQPGGKDFRFPDLNHRAL